MLLSSIIIIPGIISLLIPPAFSPGIDFSSGSAFEVIFENEISEEEVRKALVVVGHSDARIQKFASNSVFVRTKELQDGERGSIETELDASVAKVSSFSKVETVSAEVAGETVRNAVIAVLLAAVGILAYITWAFRHIPNSFRYGVSALFALVHDVLIIMGIFSILGK